MVPSPVPSAGQLCFELVLRQQRGLSGFPSGRAGARRLRMYRWVSQPSVSQTPLRPALPQCRSRSTRPLTTSCRRRRARRRMAHVVLYGVLGRSRWVRPRPRVPGTPRRARRTRAGVLCALRFVAQPAFHRRSQCLVLGDQTRECFGMLPRPSRHHVTNRTVALSAATPLPIDSVFVVRRGHRPLALAARVPRRTPRTTGA